MRWSALLRLEIGAAADRNQTASAGLDSHSVDFGELCPEQCVATHGTQPSLTVIHAAALHALVITAISKESTSLLHKPF